MPREVVVYDTNAYRSIGQKHVAAVRKAQRDCSVVSLVSKHVAMELISAASSQHRADSGGAWSGLRALVTLSRLWDGDDFIPFTQSRLERYVMANERVQQDALEVARLGTLLLRLTACHERPKEGALLVGCLEVRDYVLKREAAYGDAMLSAGREAAALALEHLGAENDRDAPRAAMNYLRQRGSAFTAEIFASFRADIDEATDEDVLAVEAEWMKQNAATAIEFAHQQILLCAGGEIDPRSPEHANSVWDSRVCALIDRGANVGPDPRFEGAPLVVVSSEKQILAAALKAGHRNRVRSLGEHCGSIGLEALARDRKWS